MFDYRDLFQWERFITPSIIKIFYWLAVGISTLFGLSGIISGLVLISQLIRLPASSGYSAAWSELLWEYFLLGSSRSSF